MRVIRILAAVAGMAAMAMASAAPTAGSPAWMDEAIGRLESELVARHGEAQAARLHRGLHQVAGFWREADGDRAVFEAFVKDNFAGDPATLDETFQRFQFLAEQLDGHMNEIQLALRRQTDLEIGPILPMDRIAGAYDPAAHVTDDLFGNRLAFVALLNFPLTTLEQRLTEGDAWTRRQWAETRLAQRYARRLPAQVQMALAEADARADQYIAEYNIWMHHVLDEQGRRLFPAGMRLLSHWNLRDQIKADYAEGEEGLARQRLMQRVMARIVDQSIPRMVIDDPRVDWTPLTNEVSQAGVSDSDHVMPTGFAVSPAPEPDTRYAVLLGAFKARRLVDQYSPTAPTHIARSFEEGREIPEDRVEAMLVELLSSPAFVRTARLIERRLGRELEPFDIWYNGFTPRGSYTEAELDAITRERYPSAAAYEADMPRLLEGLGFEAARAAQLAGEIVVEPARGSGHAWGAQMRGAKARLRTRVGPLGMDYKGYNIAVHEMGHNVEQTISLNEVDYYTLEGVPNTAFTEALAFVFQARDLELLGLSSPDADTRAMQVLDDFWGAAEIGAVALVDMRVWRWMYDNPEATPAELKDATLGIARDVWNQYFAPVFGERDVTLLGVYSHMIHSALYLPNYPIGAMIARQIEEQIDKGGKLGAEFERMARIGNVTPDMWMIEATGAPVGPGALLRAAVRALERFEQAEQQESSR